ncbi:GspH/FimT family pseudopilin [Marinicella litoralis]|uniref:Type II secretion system protein H n=1 Tax=Marinicella litoralis TaxID=644220 RepID=A0A4R6XGA3_9GAMM|nr:GspH/FimT family pseudopilin [Marinicella litoralis]TDR18425.1 prepilin-type N-terminal cleavage/methylation domain-containing protein [Marinicella litoralis]
MRKLQKKITGFTLIELIITLFIGSLLLAWGIPSYRDLKIRKQVTDSVNELSYSLSLARAEAIRYGRTVSVTPVGGDWDDGWLISTAGIDGNPDLQIYQQDPLDDQLNISQIGALQGSLQFNNVGELVGNNTGLFTLSHATASESKSLRINLSGTVRMVSP